MPATALPTRRLAAPLRSKRLLALGGDDRLVEQMRRGNELAFEVAFERHGGAILSFCRHMLGSLEEAEDAVQHTFASAWRDVGTGGERAIALKPWLFTIARNRCLSMLRARRQQHELPELAAAGISEEVERRAELRELLRDISELPAEQREALLLSEAGDLTHGEVAGVLGCEVPRVKSLVFRARSALIARREARATPCEEIREQLANLRGPSLRRNELRLHVGGCPGCRAYHDEVKRQRELLSAALPVTPGGGLELGVLAAAGIGSGGAAAAGLAGGGAAAAGIGTAFGVAGSSLIAKLALVGVMAGGGVVAGTVLVDDVDGPPRGAPAAVEEQREPASAAGERSRLPAAARTGVPARPPAGRARSRRAAPGRAHPRNRAEPRNRPAPPATAAPGQETRLDRGRKIGHEKRAAREPGGPPVEAPRGKPAQGRGPTEKPALPGPVRRGPAEPKAPVVPAPQATPKPGALPPGRQAKVSPPAPAAAPPVELPVGKEKPPKE
jgi:RNA polymerase sigma factor (sigma-70 family)